MEGCAKPGFIREYSCLYYEVAYTVLKNNPCMMYYGLMGKRIRGRNLKLYTIS